MGCQQNDELFVGLKITFAREEERENRDLIKEWNSRINLLVFGHLHATEEEGASIWNQSSRTDFLQLKLGEHESYR